MKYRPDIDGLRAISVLAVVFFHLGMPWFPGGYVGVDVFFVISGFLITSIIVKEGEKQEFSILHFYERRIRRIFPALLVVLLLTTALSWYYLLPIDFKDYGQSLAATGLFSSNFLFWKEAGYFAEPSIQKPLLHTWSLAVEEQFYIFFPLLLVLMFKVKKEKFLKWVLLAFTAISLVACIWYTRIDKDTAFFISAFRAWELLFGALLAVNLLPACKNKAFNQILGAVGLGLILAAIFLLNEKMLFPGYLAVLPCLGAVLIIYSGQQQDTFTHKILSQKPFVFIGLISYAFYLWHWPLITIYRYYVYDSLTYAEMGIIFVLSFFLSILSWRFVEQPFRQKGNLLTRTHVFIFGAVVIILSVGFGFLLHKTGGLPKRFAPIILKIEMQKENANDANKKCHLGAIAEKLPPVKGCRFGKQKGTSDYNILVWGDSHADHYVPAVEASRKNEPGRIRQISKSGCPPLIGANLIRYPNLELTSCRNVNDKVMELIRSNNEIETVVLASRWQIYTQDSYVGWEKDSNPYFLTDDTDSTISLENSRRVFESTLRKTLNELRAYNKKVLIIGPLPEAGYRVPDCLIRKKESRFNPRNCHFTDHNMIRERMRFADDTLKTLAKEYDNLSIFLPSDSLCQNDNICIVEIDGLPVYKDGDHLSKHGASVMKHGIKHSLMR